MTDKFLKDLYYNPNTGFKSLYKFFKVAKEKHPQITKSQVEDFLGKQATHQINKQYTKPKVFNTILAHKIRDNFQMDIIIYDRFEEKGFKYILVVIDVHSRFVQARAMKNRKEGTIIDNFNNIFEVMGAPKNLNCDQEFDTKEMNKFYKEFNIIPHFSETDEINKNAIVERVNRTLALLLQRWRVGSKQTDWYNVLPDIIDNYNNTYHTTIKATPIEVFNGEATNNQEIHFVDPDFKEGDQVRLKMVKKKLGKGDEVKYSKDVYLITQQKGKKFTLLNKTTGDEAPRHYKDYELRKVEEIVYKDDVTDADIIQADKKLVDQQKRRLAARRLRRELG